MQDIMVTMRLRKTCGYRGSKLVGCAKLSSAEMVEVAVLEVRVRWLRTAYTGKPRA
jgi:hypothetical protein